MRRTVFFTLGFLVFSLAAGAQQLPVKRRLVVFYSPGCHSCVEAKRELLPQLEREFRGRLEIEYRDVSELKNYQEMLSLKEKYQPAARLKFPVYYLPGRLLMSESAGKDNLRKAIIEALTVTVLEDPRAEISLIERFRAFRPLAVASAGLVDGINPCAFTVIIFFISFLSLQGYRKRELVIIGMSFILAVFLTYLGIGLGLFNLLYRLRAFWWLSRLTNLAIGLFSLALGSLSLYDFCKFKRTKNTQGLILQLPQAVKNRIHAVIGMYYRRQKDSARQVSIFRLLCSALLSGFLVSFLELVCTGQVYLPTISFVLRSTPLKLSASGYLLLYNITFILPLVGVFAVALYGASSQQFAGFIQKRLLLVKLAMAGLFFALGVFLLLR